eukprot:TRINITY_DN778077_c0_g1_i1.p1 TRINITY_DN778077_c0_g1~~TRINITY_DN778077_c0_g1_i1.p1  ORF type:complete len:270 (+),score=76.52 TRINITY_DN778077_c0_g1_i1:90-899(+)
MPATVGRVRMPHDNRMHTASTLKTHAVWQQVVGYDPYAEANGEKEEEKNGEDSNEFFKMAREKGHATSGRGSCTRCGMPGHLTYQCRNAVGAHENDDEGFVTYFEDEEMAMPEENVVDEDEEPKKKKKKKRKKKKRRHHHDKEEIIEVEEVFKNKPAEDEKENSDPEIVSDEEIESPSPRKNRSRSRSRSAERGGMTDRYKMSDDRDKRDRHRSHYRHKRDESEEDRHHHHHHRDSKYSKDNRDRRVDRHSDRYEDDRHHHRSSRRDRH